MSAHQPGPAARRAAQRQFSEATPVEDRSGARAEPFDVLLAQAALGTPRRFVPGMAGVKLAFGLARRPLAVTRRSLSLTTEVGRVAAGTMRARGRCARPTRRRRAGTAG